MPQALPLSKPDIMRIAACPVCCAMRGEQCTFSSRDDPYLLRTAAGQSHYPRKQLAEKILSRNTPQPLDLSNLSL